MALAGGEPQVFRTAEITDAPFLRAVTQRLPAGYAVRELLDGLDFSREDPAQRTTMRQFIELLERLSGELRQHRQKVA